MTVRVLRGDITAVDVDVIVNAANERMLGGGGVDGAIHRAAGPALLAACRAVAEVRPGVRCPTGEARITPGFDLEADWVVHTVGPIWRGGTHGERELLARCYHNALELADQKGATSIAFPAISTGVYRFPISQAAVIAMTTTVNFTGQSIAEIQHVCYDQQTYATFQRALAEMGTR